MIQYNGNDCLTIYLNNGNIIKLTRDELNEVVSYINEFEKEEMMRRGYGKLNLSRPIKPSRPYNKREKIIKLFNKYKTNDRTKKDVFKKISKELNISYKAVEKAYYKK